ncbi:hypothetical protein A3H89_02790 [Candidatus Amesbacteria bacterium RIFCSPLOWO2_02_FULL_48_11]|uniref:Methyltransferase small domain-containing protein n=3 Tax=Candidatus Amesiibacteriota TaxID=1752730 RepID=A0A1F4Z6Q5_9BACT|nr:MAG: Methyltransferase small [Candidatus Amesbacteria bacterium GW2011_GWC1_48_10]OGC97614.1 MAG: hypothetical protein A3C34_04925 [Candidatus Amesbacteria bacterium RIFCSPHIGHO2_02_FULL_48_21]OGD01104.1 MAG: hypothetical protein A3E17_03830 [Candidatus Amesbacteria bacterium RIFCSPHIGHO2_12_FULL_48_14]OGD01872.1 MAG: hypothetical protein A2354_04840 [Candidatus Amesbacteria bacterium RIFOXYB1_FULL_47_12]OGD07001.1 MAG: hypothetical protein A3H89_02790 [Candidatus Amesbacteria bacterium RIFC
MNKSQISNTTAQKAEFLIRENIRGFDLSLKTTWGLFSYQKIDPGTKLLAENIIVKPGKKCLDLGCGYGVLGVVMAKLSAGQVWFIDRDVVALEYAKINCAHNNIEDFKVIASNGFESAGDEKFDLIVSNLPTHTANDMIEWLISESEKHLNPGGELWVVTVNALKQFMESGLKKTFGNYELVIKNSTHAVAKSRKTG